MPSPRTLRIAFTAVSYLPFSQLTGHVRRRLRDRIVPLRAGSYLASLHADADGLPVAQTVSSEAARRAAQTVALFFAAKHTKNVPQCFDGRLTFINRTHDFGSPEQIDWTIDMDDGHNHQLWRANLSFMGYLCTAADADPERGLAFAATLVNSFMTASTFADSRRFSDIWNSYPVSQRILSLSALLIRLPEHLATHPDRVVIERFLRFNVAYLLRNLETELGYNHLERNLSALALYALAAQAMPPMVAKVLHAHFQHVVGDTIGEDGVQLERSPMYQGFVVQSLRVLRELTIWSPAQAELLARRLEQVEAALAAMTLGDDQPSMLNDGWLGETPVTSAILGAYVAPGFTVMAPAGYVRLAEGDAVALFDAGPIGADANPGHGHSDFLSFELSLGAERFIVDPGTPMYWAGAERNLVRSWSSHNGPAVAGIEPVEYLGSFKVGRRVAAVLKDARSDAEGQTASGSLAFDGLRVERQIRLSGKALHVEDSWQGGSGASRFLIPATWALVRSSAQEVVFAKGEREVRLLVATGTAVVAPGQFSCRYNLVEPAHAVTISAQDSKLALTLEW